MNYLFLLDAVVCLINGFFVVFTMEESPLDKPLYPLGWFTAALLAFTLAFV